MQRLLTIFTGALIAVLSGVSLAAAAAGVTPVSLIGLLCGLLGVGLLLYLLIHAIRFVRDLRRVTQRLIDGKYDSGMAVGARRKDELNQLRKRVNRLVDRLRAYDELRARQVRSTQRAFETIMQNVKQPVLLADTQRETLDLNPAAADILKCAQPSVSLAALRKIAANREFFELLKKATETEKTAQHERVQLQLPAKETSETVGLNIIPVRVQEQELRAVIFVAGDAQAETASGSETETG
ncbi:MAG: hypothetical protein K9N51_13220 [Candidatus Pacebacteria bacterium]|nr:hypothetical protein [Candidatus Paceibacterota bacterium]